MRHPVRSVISSVGRLSLVAALLMTLPRVAEAQPVDADEDGQPDQAVAVRGGVDLGFGAIERGDYVLINATGLLRIWNIRTDFWVPLRFLTEDFSFVTEDWSNARDFLRIGRCIRLDVGDYTPPEDTYDASCAPYRWEGHGLHDRSYLSLRLEPIDGVTLGHGSLMFQYRSSRDLARPQLGAHMNVLLSDWGNVETLVDDIVNPGVFAGRVELRPAILVTGDNWDETPDDFVLGLSYAGDFQAPLYRQTAFGRPIVDAETGDALFTRDALSAINADLHYTYYWGLSEDEQNAGAPKIGFNVFADYVTFVDVEDSHALHTGLHFLFKQSGWEVALGGEFRFTGNRYLPEYFDTEYVSRSQQFLLTPEQRRLPGLNPYITKYEYMLSRPGGTYASGQAYGQVIIPVPMGEEGNSSPLPIGFFLEDASGPANASVAFWIGPFQVDQLIVAGQYLRRNFDDLSQMFGLEGTLISLLGRYYLGSASAEPGSMSALLQSVHLDARFDRRWFQTIEGDLAETNDLSVTIGFTAGT